MKIKNVFVLGSFFFIAVLLVVLLVLAVRVPAIDANLSRQFSLYRESVEHVSRISRLLTLQLTAIKGDSAEFTVSRRAKYYELTELIDVQFNQLQNAADDEQLEELIESVQTHFDQIARMGISFLERGQMAPGQRQLLLTQIETAYSDLNDDLYDLFDRLVVSIEEQKNRYQGFSESIIIAFVTLIILLICYGIFLTYFSNTLIVRPLERLRIASQRISEGDYGDRVGGRAAEEIGHLIKAFNDMLENLERGRGEILKKNRQLQNLSDEITSLNLNLEKKVETRSRELIRVQDYLRQIIFSAPVSISIFDRRNRIVDCNSRFLQLTGSVSNEELRGSDIGQVTALETGAFGQKVEATFHEGFSRSQPEQIGDQWYIHNFCPISGMDGSTEEIMVFSENVTDVIRSEELVRQKNAELEEFVYTVSHDLKSPLFSLRGFLNILEEELEQEGSQEQKNILLRLKSSIGDVEQRVTDLLELSRVSSGRDTSAEPVDMEELISLSAQAVKMQHETPDFQLNLENVPEMVINRRLVTTLFDNLLSNSFKYRHPDRKLIISISHRREGPMHHFSYRDNGMGIRPEEQDKVFRIFYRSPDHKTEGSGVGLTIVRKVVEAMGGTIALESEPGEHTTFTFSLMEETPRV